MDRTSGHDHHCWPVLSNLFNMALWRQYLQQDWKRDILKKPHLIGLLQRYSGSWSWLRHTCYWKSSTTLGSNPHPCGVVEDVDRSNLSIFCEGICRQQSERCHHRNSNANVSVLLITNLNHSSTEENNVSKKVIFRDNAEYRRKWKLRNHSKCIIIQAIAARFTIVKSNLKSGNLTNSTMLMQKNF